MGVMVFIAMLGSLVAAHYAQLCYQQLKQIRKMLSEKKEGIASPLPPPNAPQSPKPPSTIYPMG